VTGLSLNVNNTQQQLYAVISGSAIFIGSNRQYASVRLRIGASVPVKSLPRSPSGLPTLPILYFQILHHLLDSRLSYDEVLPVNVAVLEPTSHERTRGSHSSEIYDP
jgi:hypothetical protein